jgi:hypothetical protein
MNFRIQLFLFKTLLITLSHLSSIYKKKKKKKKISFVLKKKNLKKKKERRDWMVRPPKIDVGDD